MKEMDDLTDSLGTVNGDDGAFRNKTYRLNSAVAASPVISSTTSLDHNECERLSWIRRTVLPPVACLVCILQGCSWPATPPAPDPTPNPHPRVTSHLRITVQEGSDVNNVEVLSLWNVGNIGCAPTHPISGAAMVKQVNVNERVEKIGSEYIATIVDDRFVTDKCKWFIGGWEIRFMHNNKILSVGGAGLNELNSMGELEETCVPTPAKFPICGPKSNESFYKSHYNGVFNYTMKVAK